MLEIIKMLWSISVSVIELFLLYYFFDKLGERKNGNSCLLIGYLVIAVFDIILNCCRVNSNIKLIILFLLMITVLNQIYRIGIKKLLFFTMVFLLVLIVSEFSTFTILKITNEINNLDHLETNLFLNIEAVLIAKSINLFLLIVTDKILKKITNEINIIEIVITLLPCFTNIIVIFFLVDFTDIYNIKNTGLNSLFIILITIMLLFSSISLLFIFEKYLINKEQQRKSQLMNQQANSLMKYYKEKEIVDEQIRKMYHDIKNHVLCLENLKDQNNCKEYISNIKQTIQGFENYTKTGNKMLDILINQKSIKMKNLNIKFSSDINLENVEYVKDIDIITIFSNAIDNAIEACEQIPENKRFIKINSAYIGKFILIKISNRMSDASTSYINNLKTNKKDKFRHGIGLYNIKSSVKKYDGQVSIDIKNGEFKLTILIPIEYQE